MRRVRAGRPAGPPDLDAIAVEEPLEIQLGARPLAVTMRTPGLEREMVLGFLFAEGLIAAAADARVAIEPRANVARVRLRAGRAHPAATRRGTLTTSACGVCGRFSIQDLLDRAGRARRAPPVAASLVARAPGILRSAQPSFGQTGGLHAAAALDARGRILAAAEDVGRHNAVDKVVGLLLDARSLDRPALLAVSGRASFEIVQKAAAARFPVLVAVGAPSSLAVDLAERAGIALVGFASGKRFNVYSQSQKVRVRKK
ncbi:MAG: formate dehydrogenase accessory sulfurtransferase FdhD [Planctomycetia bacterium]|nr:formate dehydrogenase accessory sulfurtransferase FdhD [Planctomycetia bacterium]